MTRMSMPAANVRCPEFLPDFTWLNAARPLTVKEDLRGRVAILDFWTYCCINCLHVLPVLARIEKRFAGRPVVVIGVHSAKFISEKDPENIRRAIERHGVAHPVVVDSEHDIWQRFAVRAWPTLVLVDAAGYVRETLSGEIDEEPLAARVEALLEEGRERGILAEGPLDLGPGAAAAPGALRFPGRVCLEGDRLVISDTGHHRILIAGLDGRVAMIVGSGEPGRRDGPAAEASFQDPQGVAAADRTLYVADTGNHLLRAVDMGTWKVRTIAGTGERGGAPGPYDATRPRTIPLRSPWGLLALGSYVLVAMAGSHQIWAYDTGAEAFGPWAGTGRENHLDGPLEEAAFAQPSGLSHGGSLVFLADSETSSIRAIDLDEGVVRTIVGRGLFDFGDRDGRAELALMQHPLDVALDGRVLYVADTYNHKIKSIDLSDLQVRTVFGDGNPDTLYEPGGIAARRGEIFIADTNHHRIVRADPALGSVEELELRF